MITHRSSLICLLLFVHGAAGLHKAVDTVLVQVPLRSDQGREGGQPALDLVPLDGKARLESELEGKLVANVSSAPLEVGSASRRQQGRLLKELAVPIAAILCGLAALQVESTKLLGKIALFFGAQTFMNLYMKAVLSKSVVSSEFGMAGVPAAFAVTAIQQLVSFALLGAGTLVSQLTPWAYTPKRLTTPKQLGMVLCFSLSFTLNIALNNFSLSMLDISVNLIIRSVAPLTTLIVQLVFSRVLGFKPLEAIEIVLMIAGAVCGLVAVIAKGHGLTNAADSSHLVWGGCICLFSLFSASMELALAGMLGSGLGLNPIDTTFYMAIPVALLLAAPVFFVPHPVAWSAHGLMTDFQILKEVIELSPGTFGLALFSGVFAMVYNILLYNIVQTLSPAFSAFTSNFNKAATIALSVLLGFEVLPGAPWGMVQVFGIAGNMVAFTVYGLYKVRPRGDKK